MLSQPFTRVASLCLAAASLAISGCATVGQSGRDSFAERTSLAYFPKKTQTQNLLNELPPPQRPVAIAVYGFTDQTGQFKPTTAGQTLSRAVTQGAGSILVNSLQEAGERSWFTVVERERLDNLLKERQIISEMRRRFLGEEVTDPNALPALLFAGVLLEGGIVGYDSQSLGASAFKFVAFRELLEAEAGITSNEPDQVALQQAIEKAVYGLVLEGVELDLWKFQDMAAAEALMSTYRAERDGVYDAADVQKALRKAGSVAALNIVDKDKGEK